jgi:hemerythrin-like domain-containing protein
MRDLTFLRNLRRQHEDLARLSEELLAEIDACRSLEEESIRNALSFFEGKVKIHLAMEDKHLYPELSSHENPEVRKLSQEYIAEMSFIFDTFNAIIGKAVAGGPSGEEMADFSVGLKEAVGALMERIAKEEEVLFPLLER